MPLDLWIPPTAPHAFTCHVCGSQFTDKRIGQAHVVGCVKRHADEIAEATEERESSALAGPLDKEKDEWAHGRMAEGKRAYNGRGDVA